MSTVRPAVPTVPASQRVLCPYCGEVSTDPRRCDACRGHFDPLSRQATQNAMGPWFIRDDAAPWRPGCSIETLRDLIRRGKVTRDTILRGPGTKQFWNFAGRTPSIANLLGVCHNCRTTVKPDDYSCRSCGAVFSPDPDRQHMGLAPAHILPGEASPEIVAAASLDTPAPVPVPISGVSSPAAISPPLPVARIVVPPPAPAPRAARVERTRSIGPWLVAGVVLVVLAMAAVFTLVVTNTISIPWLNPPAVQPTPVTAPPLVAPTTIGPPAASVPTGPPAAASPAAPERSSPAPEPVAPEQQSLPNSSPDIVDLEAVLRPILTSEVFDEPAMLARIEDLRRENPSLSKDLDAWAAAAKARGQRQRLKKIP